jgi:hypothetical protein
VKDNPTTIRLSADEFSFFKEAVAKDKTLAGAFTLQQSQDDGSIQVPPKNVEQIRDFLTFQLAASGFDRDYAPNKKGLMIENLIDKLFSRNLGRLHR